MQTNTRENILKFILENGEVSVREIVAHIGFTQAAIHRHLNKLLESGQIVRFGNPPKVYYRINSNLISENSKKYNAETLGEKNPPKSALNYQSVIDQNLQLIQQEFIYISPFGKIYRGIEGFYEWCHKFNLNIQKTSKEYITTLEKYNFFKKKGLIDGKEKLKNTFEKLYLDQVFYLDFYSIERFGKTKLGSLVLYAKQSQNRKFIKEVAEIIKPKIQNLLQEKKIDAVCIIPHTLPRKVQFMNEIEKYLNFTLPKVKLVKVINDIPVAQKTLQKLEDRIENAGSTIFVKEDTKYKNLLLIDDAIGSGATMNESARKLKEKGIAEKIIGIALTGSYKGFEVLNEV